MEEFNNPWFVSSANPDPMQPLALPDFFSSTPTIANVQSSLGLEQRSFRGTKTVPSASPNQPNPSADPLTTYQTAASVIPPYSTPLETFQAADGLAVNSSSGFIHRQGSQLLDGSGQPFTFQGIAFGNEVWSTEANIPVKHHTEADFQRVKDMGLNSVRFYLNYQLFEDDRNPYQYKEAGWQWLDQNIAWAKKHGISLVLNMHVPQGGFQSQGNGDALWTNPENQKRFTALWQAIADRYKDDPTIAAFGLLNEPIVTGDQRQWQNLAQTTANAIRQVDSNHLLMVEGAIGTKSAPGLPTNYELPVDQSLFKITDSNTAYEFHYYGPYEYTHQGLDFGYKGDGGRYPDYNQLEGKKDLNWYTATFNNPNLPTGNSNWQYFEGEKYQVNDPKIKLGVPTLTGAGVGGTVSYDDVIIKEFDPNGNLTQTFNNIDTNSPTGWNFWSSNGSGTQGTTTKGRNDGAALTIQGTTGDANLSNFDRFIIPKQGYSYQISGWMQGDNINADASAKLRIDFQTSTKPIYLRDKNFLASQLQPYLDWGQKNNVPLYMGEFGVSTKTFTPEKGGTKWVNDMLDISLANKLSFNYHTYHEDAFGLYPGYGEPIDPTKANQPLQQLFTSKLKGQ
jgi:endoglucanase